jgi:adenosylmethionine-8-amino-7-oxononanoate aminotransferase
MEVNEANVFDGVKQLRAHGWLHFYQMDHVERGQFIGPILEKGEGVHVYDTDGKRYIDAISGAYCVNIGYGRTSVLDAARSGANAIHYVSPFSAGNRPAVELAAKLAALAAPVVGDGARVFFVNSGSEAIETALKITRAVSRRRNGGHKIVAREKAYHGTTLGALSVCGFPDLQAEFGPLVPGVEYIPSNSCSQGASASVSATACKLESTSRLDELLATDSIAGVLTEVFETSSGMIPPPDGYLGHVAAATKDAGALLIIDEVITGFGRMGHWFGAERYGLKADIIACSKGLTSGYDSLGAVIVRREVADVFRGDDNTMFAHGATFGGRPGAAAAALEVIRLMEREGLLLASERLAQQLGAALRERIAPLPVVREIRQAGLLVGIELRVDEAMPVHDAHDRADRVHQALRARGLITSLYYTRMQPVVELAPPLIMTASECLEMVKILEDVLSHVAICAGSGNLV